jgi:hypothetical protein
LEDEEDTSAYLQRGKLKGPFSLITPFIPREDKTIKHHTQLFFSFLSWFCFDCPMKRKRIKLRIGPYRHPFISMQTKVCFSLPLFRFNNKIGGGME